MMEMYADVIVDISHEKLDRTFQYRIPEELAGQVQAGTAVEIPFGRGNRRITGYVLDLADQPVYETDKIKDICGVCVRQTGVEGRLIALAAWMRDYYGSTMIQALKAVLPVKKKTKKRGSGQTEPLVMPLSGADTEEDSDIHLNHAQRAVVQTIEDEWDCKDTSPYLIHGVTGSGKTEVYMELIDCALRRGRQAIVLIPEIALTYQTVMRFYRRFGGRVAVLHSRLSAGERYDQYEKAKDGLVDIMVGPRSALFAPFDRLGIIIIDEEHEDSYKSESAPRYHVRETAIRRAGMEGAKVVLGSATPSVDAYYRAKTGEYRLFELKERVQNRPLPDVTVLDMREELRRGNRGILSGTLQEWLGETLQEGRQAMLFINRRGYAGFISCRSCGHVIQCPHCSVSLALHEKGSAKERLVCHYCGHEEANPPVCPSCGSSYIGTFKVGTQQVAEQVQKCFPDARILRMDADTTRRKEGHARILSAFARREADILIGTQMIVKGHDFPDVTLVGVLAADLSLHVGDYRAGERTFQLLTQAAGRAGRGDAKGRVLIQTYTPDHYSIQAAAAQDYGEFYRREILCRRMMGYPPVEKMMVLHAGCADGEHLAVAMEYLKKYLNTLTEKWGGRIVGPADEAVARISDTYRKVIHICHENGQILFRMKQKVEQYIGMNRGFDSVAVQLDRF